MATKAEKKQLQSRKIQLVSQLALLNRFEKLESLSDETRDKTRAERNGMEEAAKLLLGYEDGMSVYRLALWLANEAGAAGWDEEREAAWIAQRLRD